MWHPGTQFSGKYGGAGLVAGLNDLRGYFQPLWFCDSVLCFHACSKRQGEKIH